MSRSERRAAKRKLGSKSEAKEFLRSQGYVPTEDNFIVLDPEISDEELDAKLTAKFGPNYKNEIKVCLQSYKGEVVAHVVIRVSKDAA